MRTPCLEHGEPSFNGDVFVFEPSYAAASSIIKVRRNAATPSPCRVSYVRC